MIYLKIVDEKGEEIHFDDLTETGQEQIRFEATELLRELS
jgi:hypothetical protein